MVPVFVKYFRNLAPMCRCLISQDPNLERDLVVETDPDGRNQADFDLPYTSFAQVTVHGRWIKTQIP